MAGGLAMAEGNGQIALVPDSAAVPPGIGGGLVRPDRADRRGPASALWIAFSQRGDVPCLNLIYVARVTPSLVVNMKTLDS